MRFDKFKQQMLGELTIEELLSKRDHVNKIFRAAEIIRVTSAPFFLIAWCAVGKALNRDLGEYAVWTWLALAFIGGFFSQAQSRVLWRVWVGLWGVVATAIVALHHEWLVLALAEAGLTIGTLLIAISQEKRARALGLAGKYDLLNANGSGKQSDVRSAMDLLELHRQSGMTRIERGSF